MELIFSQSSKLTQIVQAKQSRHLCKHVEGGSLRCCKRFDLRRAAWRQSVYSKLCDGDDGGVDSDGCEGDGGDGDGYDGDVLKVFPKILFHTYLAPGLQTGCTGRQGLPTCQLRRRTLRNNF